MTSRSWLAKCGGYYFHELSFSRKLFFQFWNGLWPKCCVVLSAMVCLQTLQKAPVMSSSYTSQLNSFSNSLNIFSSLSKAELTLYKPLGGRLSNIRIRTVGSLFQMDTRAFTRSKERANIHVFMQIFDWSLNLQTIQKKPCIANWADRYCMPVSCWLYEKILSYP